MGDILANKFPWQPLDYTKIPIVVNCDVCTQPMHLLRINDHVCFWVHLGPEMKKCPAPIAFKTSFTHGLKEFLENKEKELKNQIDRGRMGKNKKK